MCQTKVRPETHVKQGCSWPMGNRGSYGRHYAGRGPDHPRPCLPSGGGGEKEQTPTTIIHTHPIQSLGFLFTVTATQACPFWGSGSHLNNSYLCLLHLGLGQTVSCNGSHPLHMGMRALPCLAGRRAVGHGSGSEPISWTFAQDLRITKTASDVM